MNLKYRVIQPATDTYTAMAKAWHIVIIILQACLALTVAVSSAMPPPPPPESATLPGCQSECGGVNITYPFGIGQGCYREGFDVTCSTNSTTSPKPFLGLGNVEVVEILNTEGLLRINQNMANDCFTGPEGRSGRTTNRPSIDLGGRPYKFSNKWNKFVAIGCDTIGYLIDGTQTGSPPARFSTGCASICSNISYVENYTCSGVGCCETLVPKGLGSLNIELDSYRNHSSCWSFNPCSFGFVADIHDFNFTTAYFSDLMNRVTYPVTLEWSIGNQTCKEGSSTACVAANSTCYDASDGVGGYRCNCSDGFTGNPYLKGGCIDIDECEDKKKHCIPQGWCTNIIGNYTCTCPPGMSGDGRRDGSGCKCLQGLEDDGSAGCRAVPEFPLLSIILGIGFTILFLIASISWLYWVRKKAKLLELKKKFFQQNGGRFLGASGTMKLFHSEELCEATDDFSKDNILGNGASGTVYKGVLSDKDKTIVAIKKSKLPDDEGQIKQFINEVEILSSISHKNIVKILGCCLETQTPLLVYEFVSGGTLFKHIHDEGSLSWKDRLRIAAETAQALNYMHYGISDPIIHRDIKSLNILLDEKYTPKVADFGTARLVPFDQNHLYSFVRGTFGYLDPEYSQTGTFTVKSDVYSFGMVLVELLTGQKVISNTGMQGYGTLAHNFISCMDGKYCLDTILEKRLLNEGPKEHVEEIARLAIRCLKLEGKERPWMTDVYEKLKELASEENVWTETTAKESEILSTKISDDSTFYGANTTSTSTTEGESSNSPYYFFNIAI